MHRNHLIGSVRERLKRLPPPFNDHYGVVPSSPPEETIAIESVQSDHSDALKALGRADSLAKQFPTHFLFTRVLVRQEAVSSSEMEGTHSTLDALLEAEETDDKGSSEADRQVRDYAVALETALIEVSARGHNAFTIDLIQSLHASLMREDSNFRERGGVPGELRKLVVWIGGKHIANSRFNPPPPNDVLACLVEQLDFLRCEGLQQVHQSIVTQMAVAHAHFETVHPFRDGNGRVGRLVLPLMLAAAKHTPLYLSPYIASNKAEYVDALVAAQQRLEYAPLVGHLSRAISNTVDDADRSLMRLERLVADWHIRKKFRKGSAAQRLIDALPGHPVVTSKTVMRLLKITNKPALTCLGQLEDAGVLRERTGKKRNKVYSADEVLKIYKSEPDHTEDAMT